MKLKTYIVEFTGKDSTDKEFFKCRAESPDHAHEQCEDHAEGVDVLLVRTEAAIGPLKLLSVDAWRDDGGWYWNNSFTLDANFWIENPTPRRVCRILREMGYLKETSKGRVRVDKGREYMETFIEIQNKATGEPVLAISAIH